MPRIGEGSSKSQETWAFLGAQSQNWHRIGTGALFEHLLDCLGGASVGVLEQVSVGAKGNHRRGMSESTRD